jgi:hypothetical protein
MTKAQILDNGRGLVEVDGPRIFTFSARDGYLTVHDDAGTQIANQKTRADNGEDLNEIGILAAACAAVEGYYD